ncbi:HPF/RaiA family ribosome-associated protein [Ralstonia solanacearum]|uniref:HPF/RaiA family ribosome-associated protein n=1 Tax=Ralstonia solanacearum TaxID=305 RepID=UPI0034DD8EA3
MHPVEIAFEGVPQSDAIKAAVHRFTTHLDRLCCEVVRCRVIVRFDDKGTDLSTPFVVHIDVTIPGQELASDGASDVDQYVALLGAFQQINRTMKEARCTQRGRAAKCAGYAVRQLGVCKT